jgi:hypothetical protein
VALAARVLALAGDIGSFLHRLALSAAVFLPFHRTRAIRVSAFMCRHRGLL